MKKLFLLMLAFGGMLCFSEASAQTTQSSTGTSKDKYWGTSKAETRGASADAVGKRGEGLDARWNAYEDGKRSRFAKENIKNSKRMKAILKKEKDMMKKHKRDKKRLKRKRAKH
ncbi:hypothetical protein I2I11_09425 [Pontibacter sp. 172403-2]|uniref:hypothetical protein n=1 Tax=Pontibacter rufus TaxID=2791028 RepID=UPI0018AFBCEC|nr:hypothetical protein [Pontibacter sp. 172403-2]MBF9253511.1 hypothetical protein [Pontibacter sp. 172403-2]